MYWYAAAKAPEGQVDAAGGQKREEELFQDWHTPIPELIAATDEDNILQTDLYDRVPSLPWSQQNITLLGDAAHPTLPTMGQGACMALEDAIVVTQCLRTQSNSSAAFQQYESQRFARTKMIVESLQAGQLMQWENRAAVVLRETVMMLPTALLKNKIKPLHACKV